MGWAGCPPSAAGRWPQRSCRCLEVIWGRGPAQGDFPPAGEAIGSSCWLWGCAGCPREPGWSVHRDPTHMNPSSGVRRADEGVVRAPELGSSPWAWSPLLRCRELDPEVPCWGRHDIVAAGTEKSRRPVTPHHGLCSTVAVALGSSASCGQVGTGFRWAPWAQEDAGHLRAFGRTQCLSSLEGEAATRAPVAGSTQAGRSFSRTRRCRGTLARAEQGPRSEACRVMALGKAWALRAGRGWGLCSCAQCWPRRAVCTRGQRGSRDLGLPGHGWTRRACGRPSPCLSCGCRRARALWTWAAREQGGSGLPGERGLT